MRAAFYRVQGPAAEVLRLGELATPEPGPGEVRVRVHASGVNPSDWKIRKGGFGVGLINPPIIPHSDGAGEIDRTGPGLEDRVGERVWIFNGQWKRPWGTAAEYIVLPSAQAVRLPDCVTFAEGACLGIPLLTASQAIRLSGLQPGETVLVSGGAGSVGSYVIQLAKARGASVVATVSSTAKASHARSAGADHIINYREEDLGDALKAIAPDGVDALIEVDLSFNARTYPKLLKQHARVVIYGVNAAEVDIPALWLMRNSISLNFFLVYETPLADRLANIAEISGLLERGALIHTIGRRLPLCDIAQAHDLVESGTVMGKVVLDIC